VCLLVLFLTAIPAWPGEEVTDERLRMEILRVAFPEATVSPMDTSSPWFDKRWHSIGVEDGLLGEKEYQVTAPLDDEEEGWAQDVVNGKKSDTRLLRLKVSRVRSPGDHRYIAFTQYRFPAITPPMCCIYFGRVYLVTKTSAGWKSIHTGESLIYRGKAVGAVGLVDLTGDGIEEVLFEGEYTGVAPRGSVRGMNMKVFDISGHTFRTLLEAQTARLEADGNDYRRILDLIRTRQAHAREFFFVKTTYGRKGRRLPKPAVEHEVLPGSVFPARPAAEKVARKVR